MILMSTIYVVVVLFCSQVTAEKRDGVYNVTIRMPNAITTKEDDHLCHAIKLDPDEAYIIRFEPKASKSVAHHMALSGCDEPFSDQPYWPCLDFAHGKCKHNPARTLYTWALDAGPRSLPSGTGFRVGGSTGINYLVLGMHYKDKFRVGQTDNSGYILQMTQERLPYQVGYYLLGTSGSIPPMTKEFHCDTGCTYKDKDTMYPIAYRTHTHNLGVVASAYRYRNGSYTEIGRMSPQLPQAFYDVSTPNMDIQQGDKVIARCTMSSQRNYTTMTGPDNRDEMCNFYIMYYTNLQETIKTRRCFKNHNRFHLENYVKDLPENISSTVGLPEFKRIDPYA